MKLNIHKQDSLIIFFLLILNLIIKGLFLSGTSIGGDEPFSIYHAQMDVASIISLLSEGNNPPLYEILLHFWIQLFGISAIAVRIPSLIFSTFSVLFIYKLGKRFINQRVAIYASLIFIFTNYHTLFAHEARVYSFLGLLCIMSMYYFLEILSFEPSETKKWNQSAFIKMIIVDVLMIYSHYFGFFILITQILFVLTSKKILIKVWKPMLLAALLLVIAYIPNIGIFFNRFFVSSDKGTWVSPPGGLDSAYNMLTVFTNAPVVNVIILVFLVAALVKFFFNAKSEFYKTPQRLIVFWFLFIFLFMFGISFSIPMFMDRYLMPAAMAYCILIAIAADYLVQKSWMKFIIPAIVCILFMVSVKPDFPEKKKDVERSVQIVKDLKTSETLVIVCPYHFMFNFAYYYDQEVFEDFNSESIYKNIEDAFKLENISVVYHINQVDVSDFKHVIYLDAEASFMYPNNNILNTLNKKYTQVQHISDNEIFDVYEFKK